MLKIACMTLPYYNYPFERALAGIAGAGYRYVIFGTPHQGELVPEENDHYALTKVKLLLEKYGLTPVMLLSHAQMEIDQPIERAYQQLRIAKTLEIKEINALGFWGYHHFHDQPLNGEEYRQKNEQFIAYFRKIAGEAERLGITVSLKPHTGNTANPEILRNTLDRIGSPFVKACYDPGNVSFYEGLRPEINFPLIASDTVSFIAKDHRGGLRHRDFPVPGEGDVRFADLFGMLKSAGFNGSIVVEKLDGSGEKLEAEQLDHLILKARLNLERLIREAGFKDE
jgi:sugar phosphate isomerase/epimerase